MLLDGDFVSTYSDNIMFEFSLINISNFDDYKQFVLHE